MHRVLGGDHQTARRALRQMPVSIACGPYGTSAIAFYAGFANAWHGACIIIQPANMKLKRSDMQARSQLGDSACLY
jgi:hypothetical protein